MDFSGNKYYEFNRMLLLSIGLWPYDESIFKPVKMLISFSFVVSCTAAMILKIITSKYDMVLTLRILSMIIPYCIVILKYITFLLLPTSIKRLLEWVQNDWNTLKDTNELEIIKKYANFGRFCTITFSVFGYGCSLSLLLYVYFPGIIDFVAPLNFSRVRKLPLDIEYFIDEQKYFYVIFYYIYITIIFGITIIIATEMLYTAYVCHACGMFKIASYRLQRAYDQDILRISPLVKNTVIHTKIVAAIEMHRKALKLVYTQFEATDKICLLFVVQLIFTYVLCSTNHAKKILFCFMTFLWSKLAISYFIVLLIGVASLTINLFRIFQAIVIIKNAEELLLSSIFVLAHFVYMFCGNYAGQVFIDHSMGVHENVCDTRWYRIPLRQQKLILFILHRSMHSCKLVTGGTFILSLEGFTSLIATSISFFTVLTSVQH